MINTLLLLILFCVNLLGYELQEEYLFENRTVYSNDLFPDLTHKFEILKIPADKTKYRVDAQVIAKTFELYGIQIESTKVRYVNFSEKSPVDFTPLADQLASALIGRYPTMTIEHIAITPRGYLASLPKGVKAVFEPKFFQTSTGTFYILDEHAVRRYLDYRVTATIPVLHTTQKVNRRESLSGFNTLLKPVPFSRFKDTPLTALPENTHRYRSALKQNALLSERNIEPLPLVTRGQKVIVVIDNKNVRVEFGATATQEGGLYDMITILKNDGKRVRAKVIGENRVELQ